MLFLALGLTAGPVLAEPATLADLARGFAASRAMEAGDELSGSAAYRAGRFDGYLAGLAEQLQAAGAICLPGCFCAVREKLDPILQERLADPLAESSAGAQATVETLLRQSFPCPPR